ncbi:MAG: type IX secretion system membrane protein PorP/SprF [Bernardetiaceae bacterium]|nr:type IX secretion system membrane protein PorP/SprF [Bernardetiaceae bacterium]
MLKRYFLLLLLLPALLWSESKAQDLQYSQFYAAPLYLNPALAGSTLGGRANLNYRNQWTGTDANFTTYAASFDYHFEEARSSVGLLMKRDEQGAGQPFTNTEVSLIYAFLVPINEKIIFQPGLQLGYVVRDSNLPRLTYPDQFDNTGLINPVTQERFPNQTINYIDISAGAMLMGENFWFGASAHHLNQPNQSFLDEEFPLAIRYSAHGGFRIGYDDPYDGKERSIVPNFMYKRQGTFQQINLGSYAVYEPLVFGAWYRGFPIGNLQTDSGIPVPMHDAIVLMAGVKFGDFNFGYSFDWSISELGTIPANSHEISLSYVFGGSSIYCPGYTPWGRHGKTKGFRR